MARTFSAFSDAAPADVWPLLAEPARWPEWAPHVRGAWGLGSPEVRAGRRGFARLLWVVPVPARVSAKRDGRSWTWTVGPVAMDHAVVAEGSGSRVSITVRAPGPLEPVVAAAYGPIITRVVRRLAARP